MTVEAYPKQAEHYPLHANVANWLVPRVVKAAQFIDTTADDREPNASAISRYVGARCDTARYQNATGAAQRDARFFLSHAVADVSSVFEPVLDQIDDREQALQVVHHPLTITTFAVLALRNAADMRNVINATRDGQAQSFSLESDHISFDPGLDTPPDERYCPFALPSARGGRNQTFVNLIHFTGELLTAQKFGYNEMNDRSTQCDRRVQGSSARRDSRSA